MKTPEENRLFMQEAFEKAFPKAEDIRTYAYYDDFKDKKNIAPCYGDLYVVRVTINGRRYGYGLSISDIELKTANLDLFANEVERAIEAMRRSL